MRNPAGRGSIDHCVGYPIRSDSIHLQLTGAKALLVNRNLVFDTPGRFEIQVLGRLDISWYRHFDEAEILDIEVDGAPGTRLTGEFRDQAALIGLLNNLYNLGFPLVSVSQVK